MAPNTSIVALGCNAEYLVEVDDEQLRDMHLVESYEASYRPSRTPSRISDGAHGTQTVQRTEAQVPSRIEEASRDGFLRFRDEWVRNRARDIQQAASISFHTCSEDTASITALNEFYRWRAFDGFKAERHYEQELEIGMMQGSHDFGSFPKDVAAAEKVHMCRIVGREKGRRVFRKTCRRPAKSRA